MEVCWQEVFFYGRERTEYIKSRQGTRRGRSGGEGEGLMNDSRIQRDVNFKLTVCPWLMVESLINLRTVFTIK